ncbi:hypothetical protein ACHAWF_006375 [Thalassiosira exigua]
MGLAQPSGGDDVGIPTLILSALPLLCIAFIGHWFDLGLENTLVVGISRSFVQLMILGWLLQPMFVVGTDRPGLVGLYLLFMMLVTTQESVSRPKYTYKHHALMAFITLLIPIAAVSTFAFLFIIRPHPCWNPQYVIPIVGMLMSPCINGMTLTVDSLSMQIMEEGRREIELYLSFGATWWASMRRLTRTAVAAGITPTINSMNVIGLVTIPGMMTGQILGGSSVTEAAHYQILIKYLMATCRLSTVFISVFVVYRVTFDAGTHFLRTDRFIEVEKKSQSWLRLFNSIIKMKTIYRRAGRHCGAVDELVDEPPDIEQRPLSHNGTSTISDEIKIITHQFNADQSVLKPLLQITGLQFSVPKSHMNAKIASSQSLSGTGEQHSTVLCTLLNITLNQGEIGIVRGPSGCGKTTLLRVLAGLTPMDHGDVVMSSLALAECYGLAGRGDSHTSMIEWRTAVRYVTQYKVDIPGTPRDFLHRVSQFSQYSNKPHVGGEFCTSPGDAMFSQTALYLRHWSIDNLCTSIEEGHHPYLDKEWSHLSGGESQRTFLAIAMASRPRVLLLDESTSGLDAETEKVVEESVFNYAQQEGAAVLWVTHSEDIAERLLAKSKLSSLEPHLASSKYLS